MNSTLDLHNIQNIHVQRDSSGNTLWTNILITASDGSVCTVHTFDCDERTAIIVAENARPANWNALPSAFLTVMDEIDEYLESLADCDQPSGCSPIPNEEMVLLCRLRKARKESKL